MADYTLIQIHFILFQVNDYDYNSVCPLHLNIVAWARSSAEVAKDGIVVDVYSKVLSDI